MKKIIITILALVVLSLALMAEEVVFEKVNRDEASNIQGTVFIWNSDTQQFEQGGDNLPVTVVLIDSNDINHCDPVTIYTISGNYSYNFPNQYSNAQDFDKVKVTFWGHTYETDYDGTTRLDILWVPWHTNDDTIPNEE